MATDTHDRVWPDVAIPPGELLGEELEARGMSQQELARRMGRPPQMINELIRGGKALTPETALGLEMALGIPAGFWTNSESSYRLARSRIEERERLEREAGEWLPRFPVRELVKRGLIPVDARARPWEKARAVLRFLGYGGFDQWRAQWQASAVGLRVTDAARASPGALAVWLREGELDGHAREAAPYDEARFREALAALRDFTASDPSVFTAEMRTRCAEAGVAVSFVREYPKANATGAARWLRRDKGHIQLSLRHKTADVLWFSFYHEAAHLLRGRFRDVRIDGMRGVERVAAVEDACDAFARDLLVPPDDWAAFTAAGNFAEPSVRAFARRQGIHPGIVAGRLQHEKRVPYSQLRGLKMRLRWAD